MAIYIHMYIYIYHYIYIKRWKLLRPENFSATLGDGVVEHFVLLGNLLAQSKARYVRRNTKRCKPPDCQKGYKSTHKYNIIDNLNYIYNNNNHLNYIYVYKYTIYIYMMNSHLRDRLSPHDS